MQLTRPRFTVRRLMIAVAVIAILLGVGAGLQRRREKFRAIADSHRDEWNGFYSGSLDDIWRQSARNQYHRTMQDKYERAARHPYLPVEPDPSAPPPEPPDPNAEDEVMPPDESSLPIEAAKPSR